MAPEPDAVATYLERIRAVTDAATQGPWEHPLDNEVTYGYRTDGSRHIATWIATVGEGDEDISEEQNDANADFIAAARSYVPALLAAVEAVLRDHEPRTRIPPNRHYSICRACSRIWPCATVQDITSKLLSKGETGG